VRESPYFAQAHLLLRYLPALSEADCFALKGGTAINLFVRDLPRLSVDIDLAYLPLSDRATALDDVRAALSRVALKAEKLVPGLRVVAAGTADAPKQVASNGEAQIKIEPNPVTRGTVFPVETRRLTPTSEEIFELSASATVVSHADLYAGKLCAALDRSHPRDWFDIRLLLQHEGFDDRLRQAFVVYLASHPRPMAELLAPHLKALGTAYSREFAGMARQPVTVADLEATQLEVPALLRSMLTNAERRFLLSIKLGEPDWALLPIPHFAQLPAVRWKLDNIEALKRNPGKHADAVERLRRILEL